MTQYVVFKKNAFEVENEVYFAYNLREAGELTQRLVEETDDQWAIAVILE